MVKKFKDVFQSLECAPHMDELLNFVSVEKVTASSDMTLIKVNIIAERIIENYSGVGSTYKRYYVSQKEY